tara:strand:+ start:6570 stop:7229 length:660 start_codon:yes stop_codon:yes gene_type:complete
VKKEILAIIPARKGSKRLPNKNNLKIGKYSLVEKSIKTALKSKIINNIIVTSNDTKVLKLENKFKNVNFIKRPNKLSNSKSKLTDVCNHAIQKLKKRFEYFILLQPTSPFRTNKHIDRALNKVLKYKAEGLISISSTNNKEKNYFYIKKKYLSKITKNDNSKLKKFQFNGAIYVIKTNLLKRRNSFFIEGKILPFFMSNKQSIDIDYLSDFNKTKQLYK